MNGFARFLLSCAAYAACLHAGSLMAAPQSEPVGDWTVRMERIETGQDLRTVCSAVAAWRGFPTTDVAGS